MRDSSTDAPISEEVELIADYACETGENPLWHAIEQKLYWCDIPHGRIFGSILLPDRTNSATKDDPSVASLCNATGLSCCSWIEEPSPDGTTMN